MSFEIGSFNNSSRYRGNGEKYTFQTIGSRYHGLGVGRWFDTENGTQAAYSETDIELGLPYIQVTAMTVVYIIRAK